MIRAVVQEQESRDSVVLMLSQHEDFTGVLLEVLGVGAPSLPSVTLLLTDLSLL